MVHIDAEDNIFTELVGLFSEYWEESKVLTQQTVEDYKKIYDSFKSLSSDVSKLETEIHKKIGKVVGTNIRRDKTKQSKENIFIEDYRKTYQESVKVKNELTVNKIIITNVAMTIRILFGIRLNGTDRNLSSV